MVPPVEIRHLEESRQVLDHPPDQDIQTSLQARHMQQVEFLAGKVEKEEMLALKVSQQVDQEADIQILGASTNLITQETMDRITTRKAM